MLLRFTWWSGHSVAIYLTAGSHCCYLPVSGVTLLQYTWQRCCYAKITWRRDHTVMNHLVEWSQCCNLPGGGVTLLGGTRSGVGGYSSGAGLRVPSLVGLRDPSTARDDGPS